jgi:two-component system, cell cycle sensor histidine kinase and response regulator CckA
LSATTALFRDPLNLFYLITVSVLLVIAVLILGLLAGNTRRSLDLARHEIEERGNAEKALRDSNEALRRSEAKFRAIVENGYDGILFLDASSTIRYRSPSYDRINGYTDGERVGHSGFETVHPEDIEGVRLWWSEILAHPETPHTRDYRILHRDGSWRWIESSVQNLLENTDVRAIVVASHDISMRKKAEAQLNLLKHSIDVALEPTYWLNPEGRLIYVNDAVCRAVGYSREELLGMAAMDLNPRADAGRWAEVWKTLKARGTLTVESIHQRKDGTDYPVSLSLVYFRFGDEEYCHGYGVDLTEHRHILREQERLQAQLQQAQKMESIGRIAGGMAHDFNNILGVILGHAEMALEQVDPGLPLYRDLMEIRTSAARSADLTRQLLSFARKQTISPRVLDFNKAVAGTLKMLQRLIGEDITIEWRPGRDLWPVMADPSQLDQVLTNLCINARDAIGGVGRIVIATECVTFDADFCAAHPGASPGDHVVLTITDSGCGMDQEMLANLFEPYYTTKEIGKGTGLGLATVYGIVKQNSGFINVESEPGKGARFSIYLPRSTGTVDPGKVEQEEKQAPPPAAAQSRETILVVEDEPANLRLITRMLRRQGYTVLAAGSPDKALQVARKRLGEIQLLITDVIMPDMNGRDLARSLLSSCPQMKCLFMSGYTADVIATHGVLAAEVSFIQKPFSEKALAGKIRETLEKAL